MAEYIDREKLRTYPLRWEFCDKENANPYFIYGVESLMEYVEWLPAADVAPVAHGEWIFGVSEVLGTSVRCSVCGWSAPIVDADMWLRYPGHHFCGACGAKMNRKDEGDGQKD